MGIKIAFFDIDGTLVNFGAGDISEAVKRSLRELRERGVKLFIATGRPPYLVPTFQGVAFDGMMTFNGSYCFDKNGVILSVPMNRNDIKIVVKNAGEIGLPVLVATSKRMGINFRQKELDDYAGFSGVSCEVIDDYDRIQQEDVYQMMLGAPADRDEWLLHGTSSVKIVRWWGKAMDVIPSSCGKAVGMRAVLQHYGLTQEESIAFGDGGNDQDMIEYAGIGVAMGNATPEVKAAADYVTDSCADDGVYTALKHFQLV